MKAELQDQLYKRYKWYDPTMHLPWWRKLHLKLRGSQRYYPFPMFGFEVNDGWFQLLWDLSKQIDDYFIQHPEVMQGFSVSQVKEKFGGLRFYYSGGDAVVDNYVAQAETLSYTICEVCGKPGKANKTGWITVLCRDCRRKSDERKGG